MKPIASRQSPLSATAFRALLLAGLVAGGAMLVPGAAEAAAAPPEGAASPVPAVPPAKAEGASGVKREVRIIRIDGQGKAETVTENLEGELRLEGMPPLPMGGGAMHLMVPRQGHGMMHGKGHGMPGRHGPMGPELVTLTPALGKYFGTDKGVLVVDARGQLQLQDGDVLQSIGGRTVTDKAQARRILRSYAAGETIPLTVLRDRKSVKLDVVRPAHEVKRVEVTAGDGKEVRVHVMQHPRTP